MKQKMSQRSNNKLIRITIVGLGVVGGSFAMGLKRLGYKNIYGIDTNEDTIIKAKQIGLIKDGSTRSIELLKKSDLTILAVYPREVVKFVSANYESFKPGSLITDVTGIKTPIIRSIEKKIPSGVDFIFGHPMAGREKKGLDYANDEVFIGANYIITPTEKNKKENIEFIKKIAYELGFGKVISVDPKIHDEMIGYTSQLTHVLAVALIDSDKKGRDTSSFIGDSYRDLTRIGKINEKLWSELFLANKKNLLECIQRFEKELDKIKIALKDNDVKSLENSLKRSARRREKLDLLDRKNK